jgi:hypothetical protein
LAPPDVHDEYETIDFTELAGRQLDAIRQSNAALYARILKDIQTHLTSWSPGNEDQLTIKHLRNISNVCQRNVYRLKSVPTIQKWRVFFTYLDGRKPAVRLVVGVVEYVDQRQCYDDMAQPHVQEIRRRVLEASMRGEFKRRRW